MKGKGKKMKKIIVTVLATVMLCQGAVLADQMVGVVQNSGAGVSSRGSGGGGSSSISIVGVKAEYGDSDSNGIADTVNSVTAPSTAQYIYVAQFDDSNRLQEVKKQSADSFSPVKFSEAYKVKVIAVKDNAITPVGAACVIEPGTAVVVPDERTALEKAVDALNALDGADSLDYVDQTTWESMESFEPVTPPSQEYAVTLGTVTGEGTLKIVEPVTNNLVDSLNAKAGETVKVKAVANAGADIEEINVTTNPELQVTSEGEGVYSFVMPAEAVEVRAEFISAETPEEPTALEKAVAALQALDGADRLDYVDQINWESMESFDPVTPPVTEPTALEKAVDALKALTGADALDKVDQTDWESMTASFN